MTSRRVLHNPEPIFHVDDQAVGSLTRDAVWLEIEESTEGLRTLQLHLIAYGARRGRRHQDLLYVDGETLDFGKVLSVSLGHGDEARTVFTGQISAIELSMDEKREPQVQVFAEDRLMRLRMARQCRTYEKKSDAGLASEIASRHGLVAEAQAPGPTYDVVQQWNQSDLAFLRQRARLIQAEVWVEGNVLHFKSRGQRSGTQLTLTAGGDLLQVDLRADLAHQRTHALVSGHEANRREAIDKRSPSTAIRDEAPEGRIGAAVLERVAQSWELKDLPTVRVRDVPLADAEAEAWARAEVLRRGRAFVTATGTTNGHPDLVVGSRVTLEGVGDAFAGAGYYVTHMRHTWSRGTEGLRTHFAAERATLGERA